MPRSQSPQHPGSMKESEGQVCSHSDAPTINSPALRSAPPLFSQWGLQVHLLKMADALSLTVFHLHDSLCPISDRRPESAEMDQTCVPDNRFSSAWASASLFYCLSLLLRRLWPASCMDEGGGGGGGAFCLPPTMYSHTIWSQGEATGLNKYKVRM